jgi:signal transduction histidine kinase
MSKPLLPTAKILVIDDEPSNVRLLERMLDLFGGIEYRCTTDPRETIGLFAEFQPDLILTDLHMPHIDGYQLMSQLRQLIPEDSFLPIVVLTADITAETRRKALANGASDFITKPLDTTEVQLRLRNLLENRFLHLRLEEQVRQRTIDLENALDQLRAAQEQVVKQERLSALGTMAGGIAHDFNNSLTMMLGYGELLMPWFNRNAPEAKEKSYLTHIIEAAQDAKHVVSRLRDFYRPTDKGDVRAPVCLSSLCDQVAAFTAPKWRAVGNVQVRTALQEVPKVLGSGPELREVFTNLIFNAVDAMPQGGSITIGTKVDGDCVRVDIVDTGIGMTAEEKARCLEPFFTTKGAKGTGLGLSQAYGIIHRHGGRIEIESEKGRGTTFSVLLPKTDSVSCGETVPSVAEEGTIRNLRVLVVDDQDIICELISEHLRTDGHSPLVALDGQQALEMFGAGGVDLVITDQSMPGLTGKELALAVKERSPNVPVILLTGFGDDMLANGQLPPGIRSVLSKPVSQSDLRRAISEAVG